jgi:hypothetical protein
LCAAGSRRPRQSAPSQMWLISLSHCYVNIDYIHSTHY